jgi:hypothetical protein
MFRRLSRAIEELTAELRCLRVQERRLGELADKLRASKRRLARVVATHQPKISA